jgi:Skp family chaperone for outer membrane proteins
MMSSQKRQVRNVVERIIKTIEAVALEQKIDIVMSESRPPEPSDEEFEKLTPEQYSTLLSQRNLLYVSPAADITTTIVARLDAAYKEGK